LDDLISTKLDALDEGVISVSWNLEARRDFAEQRDDGLARVTTDDGDGSLGGVLMAGELLGEGFGTDDIQGSHAEQTLRVENPGGLEDLGSNGNGRVDRVGDDESESLGAELGNTLDEIAHDAGIDLEEVITGHARLAGNAGRNDNNIGTGQGVLQAIILGKVAGDFGNRRDVRKVGSDTGSVNNIIQGELIDQRASLQEERERLANATRGTENNSFNHDVESEVGGLGRGEMERGERRESGRF
jgi:hypothetical protein